MTFKTYCAENPTLTLNQLRANWGKICKSLQDDYKSRFGESKLAGTYAVKGRVDKDGYIKLAHVRAVKATASEIQTERQRVADSAAKRDGKLAELASLARKEGRKGLSLLDLLADKPAPSGAVTA